jgi:pyruvate dehydrogenase E2 component (dihydrolipoamide acetyltransferase)/2-oxoisovalerate dehydrogenase E2 component (dihydrolipoyl transacylase)
MDFKLPELGEGVYEAELVSWQVKPGDTVKRGQTLFEVMTDKATMEVPSPFAGTIGELRAAPGTEVKVGQVVLTYTPAGQPAQAADKAGSGPAPAVRTVGAAVAQPPAAPPRTSHNGPSRSAPAHALPIKAAPSVRYMARKLGVDLSHVQGSGPDGRVLLDDLTRYLKVADAGEPAATAPTEPRPDFGTPGTRLKLQGLRRKTAEHMVRSKQTVPHYTYVDECDVTDLVRLREALREPAARAGVRLTYLAFFVKAVSAALKEVPIVNASLDEATGEIVLHDHYNIGFAVATPAGLIVPVVHEADNKDLFQIARDVERLSVAARAGKTRLEDLRGGTFTITSVGNVGGLISTPIINHPEVAILGVGKIVKRPVFDAAANIRPVDVLYLSFSFDHRVVDGAVGAAFGNAVLRRLQNPAAMLVPEPRDGGAS